MSVPKQELDDLISDADHILLNGVARTNQIAQRLAPFIWNRDQGQHARA
jgi:hypothetical protein